MRNRRAGFEFELGVAAVAQLLDGSAFGQAPDRRSCHAGVQEPITLTIPRGAMTMPFMMGKCWDARLLQDNAGGGHIECATQISSARYP